jgi:RNA polymerase sigma-70 factor (ECF subfamily)
MISTATAHKMASESDKFVELLTECQSRLYAYILSILPNSSAARDVLAETNIKLWGKRQEFDQARDFVTWAFRFAYFEVLAYQKRVRHDRHIFDGDLLAELADDAVAVKRDLNERLAALETCIETKRSTIHLIGTFFLRPASPTFTTRSITPLLPRAPMQKRT